MRRYISIVALTLLAVAAGCNDNDLGIEKRSANRPPETKLASGPPDSTSGAVYKVHMFWSGSDPDGTVDHYDFIMVDHPAAKDNIDGSGPNPVVVTIPEPDDPRWLGTSATDSVFIALADTLRNSPQPSDSTGTAGDIRNMPWERWHTFFVRAVDNEGTPDPTPDYRSFNANTIAPTVFLTEPIRRNETFDAPSVVVFNWDGEDHVGNGDIIDPVAARWVLIDTQVDALRQSTSFPDSLYVLPTRHNWSPWFRWDADDMSGRRAILRNLPQVRQLPNGRFVGWFLFAVQAMDEAGAITPVFDNTTDQRNNTTLVRISGTVGPLLTVTEQFLGASRFLGGYRPVQVDIAAGQPLNFRWSGDAERYGGDIQDYRYGWDIRNPENDDEWDQNWCASCTSAPPRTFSAGTHTFTVQVRDNAESITEAGFVLQVNQVTRSRDLLWVDDTVPRIPPPGDPQEGNEDARWLSILTSLATEYNFQFDTVRDVFDVVANRNEVPPISKVFDYKSILWSVRATTGAARTLMLFVDPYLEKNRNSNQSFNFMLIYLKNQGRLWLHGEQIAKTLWPPLTIAQEQRAVNVTNWDDDPVEQHPFIDSVGTLSMLYAMGVEMFDCGAGTGCGAPPSARSSAIHLCRGFARAVPQFSETQTFSTTPSLSHEHTLTINTSDVEAPTGGDVTYETNLAENHRHMVTVTASDFAALRRGETVVKTTSAADMPEVHTHDVTLVDKVGLWGAPILAVGSNWPPAPGQPGRPNIGIINMPGAMAQQRPGLVPRAGISTPVYTFISGVPQSPPSTFYPTTADRQPVALLAKGDPSEPFYTRAICTFEPETLTEASHKELVRFILVRHFRTGLGDAP